MRNFVLLFAALLVVGCGEKSSSESSGRLPSLLPTPAEPSADVAKPSPADPPVAESPSEASSESPNSLSDADVERLLEEAVEFESLNERDGLRYQVSKSEPFSGWAKEMYDSGQAKGLARFNDGKLEGPYTMWRENGQKQSEGIFKDGELFSEK